MNTGDCRRRRGLRSLLALALIVPMVAAPALAATQGGTGTGGTAPQMSNDGGQAASASAPWPAASARAVIETLHATLLQAMKQADQLGYAGRYRLLQPEISRSYDFKAIARTVLAAHWAELSSAQQQRFLQTFRHLTIATYASRFNGYSGQRFRISEVRDLARGRKLVRSQLTGEGGDNHAFDYVLHRQDGRWRIVNVVVDGVSDLALKRSQYDSVIARRGFDALIQALEQKISKYGKS